MLSPAHNLPGLPGAPVPSRLRWDAEDTDWVRAWVGGAQSWVGGAQSWVGGVQ